jgi:hypothetical protein
MASIGYQEEKNQEQRGVVGQDIQDSDKVKVSSPIYHCHQEEAIWGQKMPEKVQVGITHEE